MKDMNDDEILILLFLHENPEVTTSTIAKNLFADKIDRPDISDPKKRRNKETELFRNQDRRVRYYLDRFLVDDVVTVRQINRKQHFSLNQDNVHLGIGKIDLITGTDEISIGLGRVLVCKVPDGIEIEPIPEEQNC